MSESAATSNAPQPAHSVGMMETIIDGIGDEFDLSSGDEKSGSDGPATSLEESDFADSEESAEPEQAPEPAEAKPPANKPAEPAPEKKEAQKPLLPEDKGTQEKPLTVKDLPEDKFIKIKVDGKEETVNLRDCVDGYIRKQTFDRAYAKLNHSAQEALQIGQQAIQERQRTRHELQTFLTSPEQIFQFQLANNPEILEPLGKLIAGQLIQWRDNPDARRAHDYERQQRALQAREQQIAAAEQRQREAEEQSRRAEQIRAVLEPGYREGMKLAGFPKVTPELTNMVKALLSQISDRALTPEDVSAAVVRAAKVVGAETVPARKPPPPVNPPRAPRTPAQRNGDPWAGKTQHERLRDPLYFLRK